jgi:yecA family protein
MNAQDLDRLEQLLSAPHLQDSLTLDALQGFFCAIASSPAEIPKEKWLASAMGESKFASAQEATEITGLLEQFAADTQASLAEGVGLDLIFYPVEEGEEELAIWCDGYLLGVALADPDWYSAGDDEELVEEFLFPAMALSGALKQHALDEGEEWHTAEEEADLMKEARENLYDCVYEAWQWGFEQRVNRKPVKREDA